MRPREETDAMGDADLVLRFKEGEKSAFEDLVRRYMKEAYAFCLRLTRDAAEAEELSQQGFLSAYRALGRFRGDSTFRSWFYRILINLNRDRIRRERRADARLAAACEEARHRLPAPVGESAAPAAELEEVVKGKIERLPERQREVLVLHLYQGLSYTEIAQVLGCSYDDVKTNLSLARKRLREELKEYL